MVPCNVSRGLEIYFKRHGEIVARHPWLVVAASFAFTVLCGAGLANFHWESNAIKLWIPLNSDFARHYDFLWNHHPPDMRFHSMIFTAKDEENILKPKFIKQMYNVRKKLEDIRVNEKTWGDHCFRRKKRSEELEKKDLLFNDDFETKFDDLDPSVEYYPKPYCSIVEGMDTTCYEHSILELWANEGRYDEKSDALINSLTSEQQVLDRINNRNVSGLLLVERNFKELLGGAEYDREGNVISAKAAFFNFVGRMNGTAARIEGVGIDNALGEYVDGDTLAFEREIILALNNKDSYEGGFDSHLYTARSFSDIASGTIFSDITMVVTGFAIVFVYVIVMLGKFDCIENKVFLSLAGLGSVYMALIASFGICCTMGFAFSPLHNFIPFLIMGLGIDDMFVIMQSWSNFAEDKRSLSLSERFGLTMQHAGVSITVTSLTDFLAFVVGATTVLPALRSFCMYCGVGILIVYFLQATWFLAWMVIDQNRIDARRNGFLPCCVKHSSSSRSFDKKGPGLLKKAFQYYGRIVVKTPFKVAVLFVTLAFATVSSVGTVLLRQEFDPVWFLPKDSYLYQWTMINAKYFPSYVEKTHIFLTDLDLPRELSNMDFLITSLRNESDTIVGIDDWYSRFRRYYDKHFRHLDGASLDMMSEEVYRARMTQFLFSPEGSKFRFMFRYEKGLKCGEDVPEIQMFVVDFSHRLFAGPREQIPAMNRVKDIIRRANFSGNVFAFSKSYAAWETDEVITTELYRNLALAFGCILATTLVLLSNWLACLQVLLCVVLTLVNVAGFMHFWGLTIDTISCTNLIICIGLCVDYAAHVEHAFLHQRGSSNNDRVSTALGNVGPAVLNGGISTFLSIVLLANSNSHVFDTFFKIFFLVVTFALYNGLVFLPVILSFVGPPCACAAATPINATVAAKEEDKEEEEDVAKVYQGALSPVVVSSRDEEGKHFELQPLSN